MLKPLPELCQPFAFRCESPSPKVFSSSTCTHLEFGLMSLSIRAAGLLYVDDHCCVNGRLIPRRTCRIASVYRHSIHRAMSNDACASPLT